jgi:hypothetical protein
MLVTTLVAVTMTATWLALAAFGSAPNIRANSPAATEPMALPPAAHVTEPSPVATPSIVQALPAAAPIIVPVSVAASPEIGSLSSVVVMMASLPPDAATPQVAPLPPVAPNFASAPSGAATPVSVLPSTCKSASPSTDVVTHAVPLSPRRPTDLTESHRGPPAEAARVLVTAHAVPLPPRRPTDLTESHRGLPAEAARVPAAELSPAALELGPDVAPPPPGETTVQQTVAAPPAMTAPAQPDSRDILQIIFGAFIQPPAPCAGTAVYDIAAHTVYMPNGERLEAHSGLGPNLDDPRSVSQKNRGVLPPQTYALKPREQLFHGVAALRLDPVGDGDMYGRVGMLAHTYMRGPRGDSNGCVSFKDYDKFLTAYRRGEVSRLLVVTHGGDTPSNVASVNREAGNPGAGGPGDPSEGFLDTR